MNRARRMIAIIFFFAIIFSGIQSLVHANSFDRNLNYYKYREDENFSYYLDESSIECTRNEPPYYALKVMNAIWDYSNNTYLLCENVFMYNYDTKKVSLSINEMKTYSEDGCLLYVIGRQDTFDVSADTPGGTYANLVFSKYFGRSFY